MRKIEITCNECGKNFLRHIHEANRSKKKGVKSFCSPKCLSINFKRQRTIIHEPNVKCAYCGKEFFKKVCSLKLSKSGLYFCCRQHKDLAQRIDGIKEIHPAHFGLGLFVDYRTLALTSLNNICDMCGWDNIVQILVVHHKDFDRKNNSVTNLQILCPTCHDIIHYKTKTGRFSRYKNV